MVFLKCWIFLSVGSLSYSCWSGGTLQSSAMWPALLCADSAEVQRDVSEVDPVGPVGRLAVPSGARRVGVSSSSSSAATASTSSSAPSTVAESVDAVGGAVAGCRLWLGGVLRGLCGGVLEAVNNLANFLK